MKNETTDVQSVVFFIYAKGALFACYVYAMFIVPLKAKTRSYPADFLGMIHVERLPLYHHDPHL